MRLGLTCYLSTQVTSLCLFCPLCFSFPIPHPQKRLNHWIFKTLKIEILFERCSLLKNCILGWPWTFQYALSPIIILNETIFSTWTMYWAESLESSLYKHCKVRHICLGYKIKDETHQKTCGKGIIVFTVLLKMSFFFREVTVNPEKDIYHFHTSSFQCIEVKINNNGKRTRIHVSSCISSPSNCCELTNSAVDKPQSHGDRGKILTGTTPPSFCRELPAAVTLPWLPWGSGAHLGELCH